MDNGRADDNRLADVHAALKRGAARTVPIGVMMRAVRMAFRVLGGMRKLGIVRVVIFAVAVLSDVRVRVTVIGGCLVVSVFFRSRGRAVMIETQQVLDAAIRSRQQPEHHGDRRADAKGNMNFWLPGNHTSLNSSFVVHRRGARGRYRHAPPPAAIVSYYFSMPGVGPLPGLVAQQKAESSPQAAHVCLSSVMSPLACPVTVSLELQPAHA